MKVIISGQDPYPIPGDAMDLSFSVNRSDKLPKSLKNIFKELDLEYVVFVLLGKQAQIYKCMID